MIYLGVNEDGFEVFILEIYNLCKDLGLTPENIASYLKDLLDFSTTDAIPFSQIPNYVKQKADEKEKLEQEIKNLEWKIGMLTLEQSDRQFLRDQALQDERMTAADLKWYSNLKAELRKYDIPVDDISKFAKAVNGIRQYGYDVGKVISEFSESQSLKTRHKMLQDNVRLLQNESNYLGQKCSSLENTVNSHEKIISIFKDLDGMGFGLEELKLLWNTINEIAVANNIPLNEAQQKFFKNIEEQYDKKIGFESKVQNLKTEVNTLTQEKKRLHEELLVQPLVGPMLVKLIQIGVNEQDIINVAYIIQRHTEGGSSGGSSIDLRSLIAELQKYGSIKSATEQLSQEADKLRNEISSLKAEKQNLEA
jgi:cell division protein FtsB